MTTLAETLLVLLPLLTALPTESKTPPTAAIVDVAVVDVESGRVTQDRMVLLDGPTIRSVLPNDPAALPAGVPVVDGEGGFLLPGLWDMHVHALSKPDDATARVLPLFVSHGVTGVRDMGSLVEGIEETKRRLAGDPSIASPRLYVSGPLLDGVKLPWYGELPLVLSSEADVARELPRLKERGMDFFKVYGGLSQEIFASVAKQAGTLGLPFAGHVPRSSGMVETAQLGQRSIEHLSPDALLECHPSPGPFFDSWVAAKFTDGYSTHWRITTEFEDAVDWDDCSARLRSVAAAGTFLTPTLVMEFNDRSRVDEAALAWLPKASREWCQATLANIDKGDPALMEAAYASHTRVLRRVRDAGIKMLAGSDSQNYCLAPGISLHWELARLVDAGLSPREAIATATVNAAEAMDRQDTQGRILPGYVADLVLVRNNPLDDIRHLRDIQAVVTNGVLHEEPALVAMKQAARIAAEAEVEIENDE